MGYLVKLASILWALVFMLTSCDNKQEVYIFSVGICDYMDQQDLLNAENDAKDICKLYRANNRAKAELLLGKEASLDNVRQELSRHFSLADEDDTVVLFFSGHGLPGGFAVYDGIMYIHEIQDIMKDCKARHKMIFADACHAGSLRNKGRDSSVRTGSVMLFLSSRNDESSVERPLMHNGVFTAGLLQGLRGAADTDRNRTVSAKELYDYVSGFVVDKTGGKQHPVMWGKFKDEMPILKW